MSDTPSKLQAILEQLAAYCDDFNPDVQYDTSNKLDFDQAEQSILALFMECLPEKSDVSNQFKVLSINRIAYDAAFNKCIDITAQNIREIGRG